MRIGQPTGDAECTDRIVSNDYVPLAFQPEFAWSRDRIYRPLDSPMQGYPFGEFPLCEVTVARGCADHARGTGRKTPAPEYGGAARPACLLRPRPLPFPPLERAPEPPNYPLTGISEDRRP